MSKMRGLSAITLAAIAATSLAVPSANAYEASYADGECTVTYNEAELQIVRDMEAASGPLEDDGVVNEDTVKLDRFIKTGVLKVPMKVPTDITEELKLLKKGPEVRVADFRKEQEMYKKAIEGKIDDGELEGFVYLPVLEYQLDLSDEEIRFFAEVVERVPLAQCNVMAFNEAYDTDYGIEYLQPGGLTDSSEGTGNQDPDVDGKPKEDGEDEQSSLSEEASNALLGVLGTIVVLGGIAALLPQLQSIIPGLQDLLS